MSPGGGGGSWPVLRLCRPTHRSSLRNPVSLIPLHERRPHMGRTKLSAAAERKAQLTSGEGWVVLWATCPSSNYMALPRDVAKILGCSRDDLAKLRRPQRAVAFLARPDHTVRVVGMHRHADLVAQALHRNEVVGIAQVTPTNVTFNIPDAVEEHLGLQTYRRLGKGYVVTGTDDTLAWVMPAVEYYPFRKADREGLPLAQPEGGVHVYLRKSVFHH